MLLNFSEWMMVTYGQDWPDNDDDLKIWHAFLAYAAENLEGGSNEHSSLEFND